MPVNLRQSEDDFIHNGGMKKVDIKEVFGRALEKAMEKRGINQEKLAELSGLSAGHISEARRGISAIGIDNLAILAAALDVMPHDLLIDDEAVREEIIRRAMQGPSSEPLKLAAHSRRKKPGAGAKPKH